MSQVIWVCEICKQNGEEVYAYSTRYKNRHLIVRHGYIYMDGVNAVPKPSWWRARDLRGHFIAAPPVSNVGGDKP